MEIFHFENIIRVLHFGSVRGRRKLAVLFFFEPAHFLLIRFGDFADFLARKIVRLSGMLFALFALFGAFDFLF